MRKSYKNGEDMYSLPCGSVSIVAVTTSLKSKSTSRSRTKENCKTKDKWDCEMERGTSARRRMIQRISCATVLKFTRENAHQMLVRNNEV